MFKRIALATLAVVSLFATSVEAQNRTNDVSASDGKLCDMRNGQPVRPGPLNAQGKPTSLDVDQRYLAYCRPRAGGSPAANVPASVASAPIVGSSAGVRPLSPSELANLAQTISPQDLKQSASAPQARPAAAPAVSQAPAQPFRVFTPGVNIEVLAGAFKTGSEGAVLNAPTREIVHAIYNLSGVTVTPAMLVNGSLIDCQKAGVEGKTRVGVKVKQNMNGLKDFSFVSVGPELKECLPGQKLYVVNANGKFIAIADDSGFLLGPQTATAGIKIDG